MLGNETLLSEEVEGQALLGVSCIRVGLLALLTLLCDRRGRDRGKNVYMYIYLSRCNILIGSVFH